MGKRREEKELREGREKNSKGKVKVNIALHGNPISELPCHMGSYTVTFHPAQVNAPRQTPPMQAGTRFTYPGGMEG